MKELEIICVVPGDLYFASEVEVLINNLRKFGYSDKLTILYDQQLSFIEYWNRLVYTYEEVKFYNYTTFDVQNLKSIYPQVIRPNILKKHFQKYPELQDKTIFYIDSDVILTKNFNFERYLSDDINYLSKTDYISASYFEEKKKNVLPYKSKEYEKLDVLDYATKLVGLDKEIAILNQENTGGAQYLLKNINWEFWEKVENDCINIRVYLKTINHLYFSDEKIGFQSWCADMWAVLWNLWLNKAETRCPEDMNFTWATCPISEWNRYAIYHNAGVTGKYQNINGEECKMYNKSEIVFRENIITPFDIKKYENIDKRYCSYNYLQEILSIKNPVSKAGDIIY